MLWRLVFPLIVVAHAASAVPCPPPTIDAGFGQSFYGTQIVSGFLWDQNNLLLYVIGLDRRYVTYIQVPQATAQNFSYTHTPDAFFQQNVEFSFHEALEAENCQPLVNENRRALLLSK